MTAVETQVSPSAQNTPANNDTPVVRACNLAVDLHRNGARVHALKGVDLEVMPHQIVGLVGESGSGKSILGLSILGMLPRTAAPQIRGSLHVCGADFTTATDNQRRETRTANLGAVFQDPMSALDPTMRIGRQVMEATRGDRDEAIRLLRLCRLPDVENRLRSYPHQLSGGLRQRVMIAMALAQNSRLVVADEPTTALDVSVQSQILDLFVDLKASTDASFLFITHDLNAAAKISDNIAVMYSGKIVEFGSVAQVMHEPQHPYTQSLLSSRIDLHSDPSRPLPVTTGAPNDPGVSSGGCDYRQRCHHATGRCVTREPMPASVGAAATETQLVLCHNASGGHDARPISPAAWPAVRKSNATALVLNDVHKTFRSGSFLRRRHAAVLRGIDLELRAGESVAIVGESGSGKTTLLNIIAGLSQPDSGSCDIARDARVQVVFQDSGGSLTPWLPIGEQIADGVRVDGYRRRTDVNTRTNELLTMVGLEPQMSALRPHQLSGGQRQRVAIARALATQPNVLLCDEPTSALDVSNAAVILNLIGKLRRELGIAVVFVTHDLAAARLVSDRISVMYLGRIVESGPNEQVVQQPTHPYTKALLASLPEYETASATAPLEGEPGNPFLIPTGCAFHPRCPKAVESCAVDDPGLISTLNDDRIAVACHVMTR
ncbi:MAG: ABC transporter ATP-binding protein [Mycobacterium sp.]